MAVISWISAPRLLSEKLVAVKALQFSLGAIFND
jgi:hypothetical protein